jgi:hypothetical protein
MHAFDYLVIVVERNGNGNGKQGSNEKGSGRLKYMYWHDPLVAILLSLSSFLRFGMLRCIAYIAEMGELSKTRYSVF